MACWARGDGECRSLSPTILLYLNCLRKMTTRVVRMESGVYDQPALKVGRWSHGAVPKSTRDYMLSLSVCGLSDFFPSS